MIDDDVDDDDNDDDCDDGYDHFVFSPTLWDFESACLR